MKRRMSCEISLHHFMRHLLANEFNSLNLYPKLAGSDAETGVTSLVEKATTQ